MRFSLLTGLFALAAAGFFIYQVQKADALVAATAEKPAPQTPAPAAQSTKAAASDANKYGVFTCTPDNFTLTSTADGYHLHGTIDTPTPGYGYTPARIDETPDAADMVFELRGPQGMVMQVIGKMAIDHMYVRDGSMQALTVRLDKAFNWGPDTIVCKNTAAPQPSAPMPPSSPEETPASPPKTPPAAPPADAPATE